ncbi:ICC-like phosphoesterase [Halanaeroarchaeum sp. HSR-CO]|uniref:metallophosphoesterase family protein n=1 Tax=Halanaeroarchaeum sp. HSR-CO TaxID=2866382 RepID=UPI00217F10DF|nr:YfcE family phosphodiesterase [Halanaeroarchaeum sp. HSR-CO]UWG48400.1 ICC-like phosphoesterase [Halanaeroarchaeum sp. HSR-CO]
MARLAVVSDTHIPERADAIPDSFREHLRSADHVIHAGDFTTAAVHEDLTDLADGNLTAVVGNMDPQNLDLPSVGTLEVEDRTFVVTHGTGSLHEYEERVARIVREEGGEDAIGVAGHTHEVVDTTVDGIRLLNPGSCTGAAPATARTMLTVDIAGADLDVTVHEQ